MLVAIDTAKAVFQLAVSSAAGQVQIHRRVSRQGLVEFLGASPRALSSWKPADRLTTGLVASTPWVTGWRCCRRTS
jgi:hypothetical protein